MRKRGGSGVGLAALLCVLGSAGLASAQGAGSGPEAKRAPAGAGGVGIVPIAPADGGGGGASGKGGGGGGGGGGASGSGTAGAPPGSGCAALMPCPSAAQGRGANIAFEISLGPGLSAAMIDQVLISIALEGRPVSWSPWTLPEAGGTLVFPLTTPFRQTCADAYGEADVMVSALGGGKRVASAVLMSPAAECASTVVRLTLAPDPAATSGTAGSAAPSAGTGSGRPATDNPNAGRGGTGSASSAGSSGGSAGGSSGVGSAAGQAGSDRGSDDASGEDDGSCGCSTLGASRAPRQLTLASLLLAASLLPLRARRRPRRR